MIFVTVGSQKFQFDRLIKAVDDLVASGRAEGGAFAQTGACTYVPWHMEHEAFLDREGFRARMDACDVVVTHGGTGAIIGAVKDGKKVIAVPRKAEFGEHVDDHQAEIVRQFGEMGLIEPCMDPAELPEAYARALSKDYLPYKSNTARFCADLSEYIDDVGGVR
ncbi:PssE/Cps14G family polysaccharide biosynthesis glycosyltransferase [uncultured Senegalimassilia sp.]|uniref:PssE/Cps14G family polysaccharide biosynthesis glycosyltransferase n=1 Tax=uncultured Senegalimassilia sp. TaxID=1714350 RepID=UPI0027DC378F|nr:PssE/Cps14G family polysaccharide biosynthesis glycosyltransferase [uncultured Senegalimassilia sp.]